MESSKKERDMVLRGLERVKPHLARISAFKSPREFYHRQYKKGGVFADGIEFIVRPELIASSIVSDKRILEISYLRKTPAIQRRMAESGNDRASFSRQLLLTQTGDLLESYVQYANLGLRDETSGLTTINATHLEVTVVDIGAFDWTEPIHFGKPVQTVGMQVFLNLEKLLSSRF